VQNREGKGEDCQLTLPPLVFIRCLARIYTPSIETEQHTILPSMLVPDCRNSLITNSTFVPAA
jgi:hypothetical protein